MKSYPYVGAFLFHMESEKPVGGLVSWQDLLIGELYLGSIHELALV